MPTVDTTNTATSLAADDSAETPDEWSWKFTEHCSSFGRSKFSTRKDCPKTHTPKNLSSAERLRCTLEEFFLITDKWEETDGRRCMLIQKRIEHGRRTEAEQAEFQHLQRLYDLRRAYLRLQLTGDANSPLIDEAMFERLREEDAKETHAG